MSSDLSALTLQALSEGVVARRFSPVDVVEACLARIAALEPKLQAFVHVHEGEARLAAQVADKAIRAGNSLGPLHGIPIALKDLVEFKDHATAAGCAVWRDRISKHTATLAQKLLAAGMIVLETDSVGPAFAAIAAAVRPGGRLSVLVGNPVAVNPDRELTRVARERDWDMRWFQHPVRLRDRVPVPPKGPTLAAGSAAAAVGTGIALYVWLRRRALGAS